MSGGFVQKQDNVPHITEFLNSVLPDEACLLGEIGYPDGNSAKTTSIMGCLPQKAIERQRQQGSIAYYVFDIIALGGESLIDTPALKRQEVLDKLFLSFPASPHVIRVPYYTDELDKHLTDILISGGEGAMLYHKNEPYYSGLRKAHATLKIKKTLNEIDVVCTGFVPPTKPYSGTELSSWPYWEDGEPITRLHAMGWCGAVRVGVYKNGHLVELGTVSSGLTDELRQEIKENPEMYIDKPILLKAMETTEGALRHPVLIHFRDDISPKDCTWEKIFQS